MTDIVSMELSCGADKAALITSDDIVLDRSFRSICEQNGCGAYGKCWMCPPDVGDIDELMAKVRKYPRAALYQSIHQIEDSFDIEGMGEAGKAHAKLSDRIEHKLREAGVTGYFHLSAGGCRLCDECAKRDNEPCRHPEWALPSMESCGVDVYKTAKGTDLKYINGVNTVTFFGMVLYE